MRYLWGLPAMLILFGLCVNGVGRVSNSGGRKMSIKVNSSAFHDGERIPSLYTCDGDRISPPLSWTDVSGVKSFVLIADDPDAPRGTFVHWVLFNLPADTKQLPAHVPTHEKLPNGAVQGRNSGGGIGYTPPCPPSGTHRYFFKVYALDKKLDLPSGATKADVSMAMEGHVLGEGQLMGTYRRK